MKTILIATDFSDAAMHAARYAASMAGKLGVQRIVVYHAFDFGPTAVDMTETLIAPHDDEIYRRRVQLLDNVKNELHGIAGPGVSIVGKTETSPFQQGIERSVTEYGASMVVIGSTGKGKLERLLIGSNAAHLLGHMRVPLLIVPAASVIQPVKTVVFACDYLKITKEAPYLLIKDLVCRLEAKLFVVNIVNNDGNDEAVLATQDKLNSIFYETDTTYHYTSDTYTEEGIQSFAESYDAQLVIVIARRHGIIHRLLNRSVSKKLALVNRFPLLVIR